MRLLCTCVVSVAVASLLCPSGIAAQQPARPSERRNPHGRVGARFAPGPPTERRCAGLDGQEAIGHPYLQPRRSHVSADHAGPTSSGCGVHVEQRRTRLAAERVRQRDSGRVQWVLRLLRHVGNRRTCAHGDASHSWQHACRGGRRGLRPAVRILWRTASATVHGQVGQRRRADLA